MSMNFLDRYRDHALLIARVGVGLNFIWYHGWGKLSGGPERWAQVGGAMGNYGLGFAPEFWGLMAALGETVGALCIILGLFYRPAALVLAFIMMTATIQHWVGDFPGQQHPMKNFFFFLGFAGVGAGRFSLDAVLFDKGRGRSGGGAPAAGSGTGGPGG
jgi:putative oxidoreductase